jgi:hypothetical protein
MKSIVLSFVLKKYLYDDLLNFVTEINNNKETSFKLQQHSVKLVLDLHQLLQMNLSSLLVDTIQQEQVLEWIFTM